MVSDSDIDYNGFGNKYEVKRRDISPRHTNCEYLVLDLTHDLIARKIARKYVKKAWNNRPIMSAQLVRLLDYLDKLHDEHLGV